MSIIVNHYGKATRYLGQVDAEKFRNVRMVRELAQHVYLDFDFLLLVLSQNDMLND
jgi:hypothetical protein